MIYNPDGAMRFAEAGGGLAVCGNTGITIFSATGRRTCRDTAEMFTPAMRASKKYTVAYDSGGKKYYIYNSFTRVFTGETEYPVYGMSVADNGYFLLITGSDLSASSVVLYDSDFNPVAVLGQSMHTAAAELDREGRRFAVVSEGITEDGRFSSFVRIFKVGEKDRALRVIFFRLGLRAARNDSHRVRLRLRRREQVFQRVGGGVQMETFAVP